MPAQEEDDSLQSSTAIPREGFGDLDADEGTVTAPDGRLSEDKVRQGSDLNDATRPDSFYRGGRLVSSDGEPAAIVGGGRGLKSSWKARRRARPPTAPGGGGGRDDGIAAFPWRDRSGEREQGRGVDSPPPLEEGWADADDAVYISPAGSPERSGSQGSSHGLFGGGGARRSSGRRSRRVATGPAPLLNRIQQAIQQRLDGTAATAVPSSRQPKHLSTTRGIGRGTRSTAGKGSAAADSSDGGGTGSGGGGMTARGRDSDTLDPLLPPPSSSLPPSCSSRGSGEGAQARGHQSPRRWSGGEGRERVDRLSSSGGKIGSAYDGASEEHALEWPSLLGALGTGAPSPPPPDLNGGNDPLQSQAAATAAAAAAAVAADAHARLAGAQQEELPRVRRDIAEAAATTVITSAARSRPLSASPPRGDPYLLRRIPSPRTPRPLPPAPPPPPIATTATFVPPDTQLSPPPPPGICRGVGVEVASRLRERAWFTGTRAWGESGVGSERRRGMSLAEGFEPDAVGSLFPLDMTMQVRQPSGSVRSAEFYLRGVCCGRTVVFFSGGERGILCGRSV